MPQVTPRCTLRQSNQTLGTVLTDGMITPIAPIPAWTPNSSALRLDTA